MIKKYFYISEITLNRSINLFSFLLMRLTGIALSVFIFLHIWTIGQIQKGNDSFNEAMRAYDNVVGWTMEYLLLLAVLYHMFNGLRLIVADFFNLTERQRGLLWIVIVIVVLIASSSLFVFFPIIPRSM
ncbi:MAG: succinate dehydrogenase, cytochrome b556 subunit [Deltaproteobacteria bacterium]|nr:succinate dehydrogenase, cytochrome b556 subunit [Deltaproteobacteria bacterium]